MSILKDSIPGHSPFTADSVPVPSRWPVPTRQSWEQLLYLTVIPLSSVSLSLLNGLFLNDSWLLIGIWALVLTIHVKKWIFPCLRVVLIQHSCDVPLPICSCVHRNIHASLGRARVRVCVSTVGFRAYQHCWESFLQEHQLFCLVVFSSECRMLPARGGKRREFITKTNYTGSGVGFRCPRS